MNNTIFLSIFQISWIRKRDLHILTAGVLTYTSDERFQVGPMKIKICHLAFCCSYVYTSQQIRDKTN